MRKLFTVLVLMFFTVYSRAQTINGIEYLSGEVENATTAKLWFNASIPFGDGLYVQCRYNSGSTFTGFIRGSFDDSNGPTGSNWFVLIDFGVNIPVAFDIEGAKGNFNGNAATYDFTGFGWTESLTNLPVEFSSFTAKKEANSVALNWTTLSEENNAGFDIEKSVNGKDFEVIGHVEGAGNSIEKIDYNFMDENPINGVNYYRLKQTDFDGAFEYSEIVSVEFEGQVQATIFPNPTANNLTIRADIQDKVNIRVFNPFGELVYQNTQRIDNQADIDFSALPAGNYFIHITNDATQKVIFSNHFTKQ